MAITYEGATEQAREIVHHHAVLTRACCGERDPLAGGEDDPLPPRGPADRY